MWEFGDTSSHVCGKDVVVWDSCDMRCGSQDAECRPARCLTLKLKSGTRRMRFSSRLWTVPGSCWRTSCQSLLIYKSGPKSVSVSVWRTVCLLVVDVQVCTVIVVVVVVVLGIRVRSCWSVGAVCTVEAIISLVETFSQREQTVELIALLRRPIRVQVSVAPCRLAGWAAERCELGCRCFHGTEFLPVRSLWSHRRKTMPYSVFMLLFSVCSVLWQYYFVLHNFNKHLWFFIDDDDVSMQTM